MFSLRQMVKASPRLFSMKFLERIAFLGENTPKLHLRALEGKQNVRKFSVQVKDNLQNNQQMKEETLTKHPVGKVEAQLRIMFTCQKCMTRNSKIMTKLAYEKGVVIIRCDGCKNNHLIADNLGWFGPLASKRNIEKIMKEKGHTVKRLETYGADSFQVVSKDEEITIQGEKRIGKILE